MHLSPASSAALAKAEAAISRAFADGHQPRAPVRQVRYVPPSPPPVPSAREARRAAKLKAKNLAGLEAFVSRHLRIAADKITAEEADEHLASTASRLHGMLFELSCPTTPRHLVGIDAWDISEARERVCAAMSRAGWAPRAGRSVT